jgi:hypothetical protein
VKLPADAAIAKAKVANYLLQWRPENGKSRFLAQAGYTSEHADQLAEDIRHQLLPLEADFEESTEYGDKYRIVGALIGPNGRTLPVVSVWMIGAATRTTKFLTLYPAKEA